MGDVNQLDSVFLRYENGLVQQVKTSTHDGHIMDFFTDRPHIYNRCFPMISTVKTKNLAVLAYNGSELVRTDTNRRNCML